MATAYDYAKQMWVTGPEGAALLVQQLSEDLQLLDSPRGREYFLMIAKGAKTDQAFIDHRNSVAAELASVQAEVSR